MYDRENLEKHYTHWRFVIWLDETRDLWSHGGGGGSTIRMLGILSEWKVL